MNSRNHFIRKRADPLNGFEAGVRYPYRIFGHCHPIGIASELNCCRGMKRGQGDLNFRDSY